MIRACLYSVVFFLSLLLPVSAVSEDPKSQGGRYLEDSTVLGFGLSATARRLEQEQSRLNGAKAYLDEWKPRLDKARGNVEKSKRDLRSRFRDHDANFEDYKTSRDAWRCPEGYSIDDCSDPSHKIQAVQDYSDWINGIVANRAKLEQREANLKRTEEKLEGNERSYNAQTNQYYEDLNRWRADREEYGDTIVQQQKAQRTLGRNQKAAIEAKIKAADIDPYAKGTKSISFDENAPGKEKFKSPFNK